jgi:RNA polymerase sigma-70 factor (ECF subfamily)
VSALDSKTELDLINRARRGSVDAFERLVTHYQDPLYRFLLVRGASRADAEDALQETFVAVFRHLQSYKPKYRFSTWLFTIALRQLGKIRYQRPESTDALDDVACGQAGPEQHGIQVQRRQSVWEIAKICLGEAQFTALWLFYIEDMPLAEIAKIMKRPSGWVKVNLMRARRRLSKELQDHHLESVVSRKEIAL